MHPKVKLLTSQFENVQYITVSPTKCCTIVPASQTKTNACIASSIKLEGKKGNSTTQTLSQTVE